MDVALDRVEDGKILTKKLSEKIPDILFLDIHMPCKDGLQCFTDIRTDNQYDERPVIIYPSFDDRQKRLDEILFNPSCKHCSLSFSFADVV